MPQLPYAESLAVNLPKGWLDSVSANKRKWNRLREMKIPEHAGSIRMHPTLVDMTEARAKNIEPACNFFLLNNGEKMEVLAMIEA